MDLNLGGRLALITGGSKGIGLAVAEALAAEGCSLHLAARGEEALKAAADSLSKKYSVTVETHAADLEDQAAIETLGRTCRDVDILINCAGDVPHGNLVNVDSETWRRGWELKVFSTIDLTRIIFGAMCERGSGVIVTIVGTSADVPDADHICAGTANASLSMLTRSLGGAGPASGVRVLGVNPGLVQTERMIRIMEPRAEQKFGDRTRWGELLSHLPYERPAYPTEIADVVAFLASDRAAYVSGVVLPIDGGFCSDGKAF
jgi:NAD(P)-dependent dehydrogenase (short-subunit alcohol dehydrogenase family)